MLFLLLVICMLFSYCHSSGFFIGLNGIYRQACAQRSHAGQTPQSIESNATIDLAVLSIDFIDQWTIFTTRLTLANFRSTWSTCGHVDHSFLLVLAHWQLTRKMLSPSTQGRFYAGARGAQAPQIFWFQQQKYAFLKSRLFLYSGEINTRISQCISNDEITDQISVLSTSCYSLLFVTLLPAMFSILQNLVTSFLSQLLFTGLKLRNVLNTNFFLLHRKFQLPVRQHISTILYLSSPLPAPVRIFT